MYFSCCLYQLRVTHMNVCAASEAFFLKKTRMFMRGAAFMRLAHNLAMFLQLLYHLDILVPLRFASWFLFEKQNRNSPGNLARDEILIVSSCSMHEGQDFSFIAIVQRQLSQWRLCHSEPNQYSLTFVVRCGAAGVRLEPSVYKGWALERADRPRCDH